MIFPHCLLNNFSLLHARHKTVVNAKRYSVPVCKVGEDSRFFRTWRILRHRPAGFVKVSADVVIGVEPDYTRNSAVKEILCADNFKLFVRQIFFFRKLILMQFLQIKFRFSLNIRYFFA